ncbi:MAG: hypothetical protein DME70_09940, partial [Verrucomicrobia bacterium]
NQLVQACFFRSEDFGMGDTAGSAFGESNFNGVSWHIFFLSLLFSGGYFRFGPFSLRPHENRKYGCFCQDYWRRSELPGKAHTFVNAFADAFHNQRFFLK